MPNVQATKAKINKWNYIELKNFCTAKETIDKLNRQPTEWEKIFTNHIAEIYKELIKQNPNNLIEKWAKDLKRQFSKEDIEKSSVLSITNHEENADQNHNDISPQSC